MENGAVDLYQVVIDKINQSIRPELSEFPTLYAIEVDESYSLDLRMKASKILWEYFEGKLAYFQSELVKHRDRYFKLTGEAGLDKEVDKMTAMVADLSDKDLDLLTSLAQALTDKR